MDSSLTVVLLVALRCPVPTDAGDEASAVFVLFLTNALPDECARSFLELDAELTGLCLVFKLRVPILVQHLDFWRTLLLLPLPRRPSPRG